LRSEARAHADAVALTQAAKDIGMTTSGLHSFLGGTNPQAGTIRKLTAWYLRRALEDPDHVTVETVSAALSVLVTPFPPHLQAEARSALIELLQRQMAKARIPEPSWLTSVLVHPADEGR
jgi:hypothetical protein